MSEFREALAEAAMRWQREAASALELAEKDGDRAAAISLRRIVDGARELSAVLAEGWR